MRLVVVLTLLAVFAMASAAATAGPSPEFLVQGDRLRFEHGGCRLEISLRSPLLFFHGADAPVGNGPPVSVKGEPQSGAPMTVAYEPLRMNDGSILEVELRLQWFPEELVVRKWAVLRVMNASAPPPMLEEALLETLDASALLETPRIALPRSVPAFYPGFFVGIEFPISSTRVENGQLFLAHRPKVVLEDGLRWESRRSVYGAASSGGEQSAFFRYIGFHRPPPAGLHFNYNSWWTSPVPFSERDILALTSVFEKELYAPHGVALDSFTIDMGWSNPKSVWEIDAALFPEGFSRIQTGAERMGGRLGLWISPSSHYPPALDPDWALDQGYESFQIPWGASEARLLSLAGKRYGARFKECLVDMVARHGVRQIKLDGYYFGNEEPFGAEAAAAGGIAALQAVREAAPDVWLEGTFDANASPWWLFYLNSVIGGFGDDSPYGRVPCPRYRESYTSARDYYNLQAANRLASPIAAQEILGVIHQSEESFMNDAVMTLMRGNAFTSLYINPKFMDKERWAMLARLMRWARDHEARILSSDTHLLQPKSWLREEVPWFSHSAPMPREAYGYAHWTDVGGLAVLRNPWIAPQSYSLTITVQDDAAISESGWTAVSLYPEPRRYGTNLKQGDVLEVALAPYETLLLEIGDEFEDGALPEAADCTGGRIDLHACAHRATRVAYDAQDAPFGPDWTDVSGGAAEVIEVSLDARAIVNAPHARLLALVEGKEASPRVKGALKVNGVEVAFREIRSDQGFAASSAPPSEYWTFLEAPLDTGDCRASLTLTTDNDLLDLSVWVWAFREGKEGNRNDAVLPAPEEISLDGAALLPPGAYVQNLVCETRPRPLDRIKGVFLDALEPISERQGWGKLQRNQSVWERPLTLGGKRCLRGLGVHAESEVVYALDGAYAAFEALAGADGANRGTVVFEVYVDGELKWASGLTTRDDAPHPVLVDVTDAKELRLFVGDGGDGVNGDHANWADAKLLR